MAHSLDTVLFCEAEYHGGKHEVEQSSSTMWWTGSREEDKVHLCRRCWKYPLLPTKFHFPLSTSVISY